MLLLRGEGGAGHWPDVRKERWNHTVFLFLKMQEKSEPRQKTPQVEVDGSASGKARKKSFRIKFR
jgi:hypothetical protein